MIKIPIYPLFYDYDLGQVVSNIAYIRWLEHARCILLDESPWSIKRLMDNNISPILMETQIQYKKSIRIGMKPELRMWSGGVGKSGWKLEFEFVDLNDNSLIATAWQKGCFISIETGRPVASPDELREHFDKVLKKTE